MKKIKKIDVVIAIMMAALSVFLLYLGANFKIEKRLAYSEEGNVDYRVYLKENNDYSTPFLGKGRKYIASLIDHIEVNYKYAFKSNVDMDYTCNYYVLATASIKEGDDDSKVIYQKDKYLIGSQTKQVKGQKELRLDETVNVDYDEYNKIVSDFNTKYGLGGNKNTLSLSFGIELAGKNDDFETPLSDNSGMELSLPLTDKTLAISAEYREIDDRGTKIEVSSNKTFNSICYILGVVFGVFGLGMIAVLIKKYLELKKKETRYQKEKAEIISRYGRVISNVDDIKSVSATTFIDVDSFEDLLNIRDCLDKPVLFSETHDGQEVAWFLVVDNETAYRYVLQGKEESKDIESGVENSQN